MINGHRTLPFYFQQPPIFVTEAILFVSVSALLAKRHHSEQRQSLNNTVREYICLQLERGKLFYLEHLFMSLIFTDEVCVNEPALLGACVERKLCYDGVNQRVACWKC